ncbi:hypothetical protein MtrunA17_Chr1g0210891 [Medicago truncatula]|nr:hypothetical protein MtrunA17_Chr1g0210891 [Medicago truncatula]
MSNENALENPIIESADSTKSDNRQGDNNQTVIETTPCSKLSGKRTVDIVGPKSLELNWGITQPTKHGK